ncbi:hypothetical protein L1887_02485 [Cichorium endivia]|nr:hypothetical protein L1887_02485 [Cichorium endivia]
MGQLLLVWQGGAFDKKEITLPFGIIGGDIVYQMGSSWFNLEKNAIRPVCMQLVDRRDLGVCQARLSETLSNNGWKRKLQPNVEGEFVKAYLGGRDEVGSYREVESRKNGAFW